MEDDSHILIGPDGTVLAAAGNLPPGLVDAHLGSCESLSQSIRDAGTALLSELRASRNRMAVRQVPIDDSGRSVQLIAIEALAIRRTSTDVRVLFSSKLAVVSSQAAAADVTLRIVVADDFPAVIDLDSEKLAWAVTTLVGNALRYVQSGLRRLTGGTITVRATFDAPRSQAIIEVEDDGPGIPADTVRRLFKRDGLNVRGSGLALLVMSDMCAAHGGTIEVRSRIGTDHGTTVRLTLSTPTHRSQQS
jgi:signal transduction histidine kinase